MLQNVMTVTLHLYTAVFKKGCWKKDKITQTNLLVIWGLVINGTFSQICYCKILRSSDSDLETTRNTFCGYLVLLNAIFQQLCLFIQTFI